MAIEITAASVMGYIMPVVTSIVYIAATCAIVGGLGYYLLVIKRRKQWNVNIWEQKADGTLQMITKDVLIEKRINKGKQLMYKFKRQNALAFPPPWQAVYRVRSREYCDYLRLGEDFLPMEADVVDMPNLPKDKKGIINKVKEKLNSMLHKTKKEIEQEFYFLPIHRTIHAEIKFKPMDFDVNMMRVNAIDLREKIYADKMDFLQKYGTFIAFGLIVVLIIVVLYMSYGYSEHVIDAAMGKAQETLSMVQSLANKIGGTPPPQ